MARKFMRTEQEDSANFRNWKFLLVYRGRRFVELISLIAAQSASSSLAYRPMGSVVRP
jgi:hypothetical protein